MAISYHDDHNNNSSMKESSSTINNKSQTMGLKSPERDLTGSINAERFKYFKACCPSFQNWLSNSAWPGMGLFGESYLLFSIGTLKPIWEYLFPACFQGNDGNKNNNGSNNNVNNDDWEDLAMMKVCSNRLLHSISYSAVLGVITGMVLLGWAAQHMGRRRGSLATASLMSGGAAMMTLVSLTANPDASARAIRNTFRCMSVSFFVFGIGVGGEYPLSASLASERTMGEMKDKKADLEKHSSASGAAGALRRESRSSSEGDGLYVVMEERSTVSDHDINSSCSQQYGEHLLSPSQGRGRAIQLVFTMQGLGILFNSITMTVLLVLTGQMGDKILNADTGNYDNYNSTALLTIWRITYASGTVILTYVLLSRYQYLKESKAWQDDKQQREEQEEEEAYNLFRLKVGEASSVFQRQYHRQHRNDISLPPAHLYPTMSDSGNRSHVSTVSSLSAPTVAVEDCIDDDSYIQQLNGSDENNNLADDADCTQANKTVLILRNFGVRLVGSSLSWLLWDVAFYGNKLFQSSFLLALTGQETTTLLQFGLAATLNATAAAIGYFGAAAIVDHPAVGRVRLQLAGFLITGALFVMTGFLFDILPSMALVTMYLVSSFFGQLGPNCTTFLIPAEIFPTEMRTMCHGISAAAGKTGALIAAIMFNYVENDLDMFLIVGYACFAAAVVTYWTIPESSELDLCELDRKWRLTLAGRKGDYEGQANQSKHLSYYERQQLSLQRQHIGHDSSNQYSVAVLDASH